MTTGEFTWTCWQPPFRESEWLSHLLRLADLLVGQSPLCTSTICDTPATRHATSEADRAIAQAVSDAMKAERKKAKKPKAKKTGKKRG